MYTDGSWVLKIFSKALRKYMEENPFKTLLITEKMGNSDEKVVYLAKLCVFLEIGQIIVKAAPESMIIDEFQTL